MRSIGKPWPGSTAGLRAAATGWLVLTLALAPGAGRPASAAEPAADSLPPVEMFYRHADLDAARLSPSGQRLAVTVSRGQRVALAVFDLAGAAPPQIVAHYADADVRSFDWVNDERLVFSIVELSAGSGDQRWGPGLLSVGLDGARPRLLVRTGWDFIVDSARTLREPLEQNHALLAVPAGAGDEVVVGQYQLDGARELKAVAPLRLNVLTGRVRSIAMGMPEGVTRWWFDPQGEPRVGESERQGQVVLWWRAPGTESWQALARFAALARPFSPVAVDAAGQLFVTVPDPVPAGTTVLKRFDFTTGRPEREAVVRTPGFDFRGRLVHDGGPSAARSAQALGVQVQTDAETAVWFDPRLARLQQLADQKLPGRSNRLSCSACLADDAVLLVRSWSDQDPGQLWLYRVADAAWQRVGVMRDDVDPRRMATLDFHRFKARDGLEIPVWVTLPPASAPQRRPAVLLVHGGPWVRGGAWHWNPDAQFLASRGYVVIEPEFRGSTGYGVRLHRAGFRQWGQAMQDDLVDALQWAVGQGWVDPDRVCIAGASYGGYAALMGLVRHPALFRCGVAWAAVSEPRLLFEWNWASDMGDEGRLYSLPQMIGDPVADAEMLAANSPLAQAARIQAPLLLAYGQRDRRVPIAHGERLRAALRAAGRDPEWVVYPDEGHGWLRPENRFDFARRLERFLAKHLQPAP